jgi:hypothetical protein
MTTESDIITLLLQIVILFLFFVHLCITMPTARRKKPATKGRGILKKTGRWLKHNTISSLAGALAGMLPLPGSQFIGPLTTYAIHKKFGVGVKKIHKRKKK